MRVVASVLLAVILSGFLLLGLQDFPAFGHKDNPAHNEVMERYVQKGPTETGASNVVAGIILDYRAFDTFVEATVLFAGLLCVVIILNKEGQHVDSDHS